MLAVLVIGYFVFMSFVSSQMHSSSQKTWDAMKESEFSCPPGTEVRTGRWGKLGYSRTCTPLKQGKWEAWEDGDKHFDGYYLHGQKHGKWIWYKANGEISYFIVYENGREVSGSEDAKRQN